MSRPKRSDRRARAPLGPGARVVVWSRVSREGQERGWSLAEQSREIREHARTQGWVVAEEIVIYEHAARGDRFDAMLDLVERDLTIAGIVSTRHDRLHRADPTESLRLMSLRRTGLKLKFVKEDFDQDVAGGSGR